MGMAKSNGSADWAGKDVFTTGEAAEICKVSQQTIIRNFDRGALKGYRVPGSRFRRIPRENLLRFMKANNIPTDILESPAKRILLVDDDPAILDLLQDALGRDERYELRTASTGYDAGLLTQQFRPHLILLDYMLPDINGNVVLERIRNNAELNETRVIIVSGVVNQEEIDGLRSAGANDFIKKPFNIEHLISRIEELLET